MFDFSSNHLILVNSKEYKKARVIAHVISSKALRITYRAVREYDNIYIVFPYCSGSVSHFEDTTSASLKPSAEIL